MKDKEKKPAGSLFVKKVLEEKEDRELDFIVDLIMLGFVVLVLCSTFDGFRSIIDLIKFLSSFFGTLSR